MRAAVSRRYGPPEVVVVEDVAMPTPASGEVLVAVHFTTVNRTDCHYRSGRPLLMHAMAGWRRPRATVLGTEFSGVVEALGPDVEGLSCGDRIVGWVEGRFGAHAEYLTVNATRSIALAPEGCTLADAAALTEGSHYALNSLRKLQVGDGTSLLVYGATGSIGSAAVQLAVALGATVTAVGPARHASAMRDLGADRVVSYDTEDVTALPDRFDAVLDAWGHANYFALRRVLKPGGTYVSTGAGAYKEILPLVLASRVMPHRKVRFAYPHIDQAMVQGFASQLGDGSLRPLVDRRYDLVDIVDAYRYVETGQKLGNVLITVRGDEQAG